MTRILMLGCGQASTIHSRTLRRFQDVVLSYASSDASRAEEQRRRFGGVRAFGSYREALLDAEIDVVIVCTPTATHRELTLLSLAAGKHVIVEKPAFMKATDADVVRDAACHAQRRVFVAENYYYKPLAEHLRETISAGDLGDVRFVSINATKHQDGGGWRDRASLSGGGALFEGGVHWVSFASNIGLEVEHVTGYGIGVGYGTDRSALVVFRYANGAVGTLAHSWELAAPFGGLRLSKVQGTRGSVTFESNGTAYVTSGRRRSLRVTVLADFLGRHAMMRDFLEALHTGRPERFTLDMAQRDLGRLESIERFARRLP